MREPYVTSISQYFSFSRDAKHVAIKNIIFILVLFVVFLIVRPTLKSYRLKFYLNYTVYRNNNNNSNKINWSIHWTILYLKKKKEKKWNNIALNSISNGCKHLSLRDRLRIEFIDSAKYIQNDLLLYRFDYETTNSFCSLKLYIV